MPHETPAPAPTPTEAPRPVEKVKKTDEEIRQELEEAIKHIGIVDVGKVAEAEARDAGEAKLNRNKSEMKGVKGFFKKIWNNMTGLYKRHKAIAEARADIYKNDDVYSGGLEKGQTSDRSAHREAMEAITERFVSEYEGVIKEEAGEKKKALNEENAKVRELKGGIQKIIKEYASGALSKADFDEKRKRLLGTVKDIDKDTIGEGKMYADNITKVAEAVKNAVDNGISLETIDLNFDLTVGQAASGVRTEFERTKADKLVEYLGKRKGTNLLLNETVMAGAVSVAMFVGQRALRTFGKMFGAGAVTGAGIAAFKENTRMKQDRSQHLRDMAKGKEFDPKEGPRRQALERTRYESKTAAELAEGLNGLYKDGDPKNGLKEFKSQAEFNEALDHMAEIEARIDVSNKEHIDLISYSNAKLVEREKANLEISQARAKALFKKACEQDPAMKNFLHSDSFSKRLDDLAGAFATSTLDKDMAEKDRLFRKLKRQEMVVAAAKGYVTGTIIGAVFQEVHAAFDGQTEGLFEHSNPNSPHITMLNVFSGANHIPGAEVPQTVGIHDIPGAPSLISGMPGTPAVHDQLRFPAGTVLSQNSDGTMDVSFKDPAIPNAPAILMGKNIPISFLPNGMPTPEMQAALDAAHLTQENVVQAAIATPTHTSFGPHEYMMNHSENATTIARDGWYHNDTEEFDQNELRTHWGGVNGSGMDEQGRYVLSVKSMMSNGSFNSEMGLSADPEQLAQDGKLFFNISLSEDSQHQVFKIPIDADGNIVVDPNTPVGKELTQLKIFETDDEGHPVFNARFGEVAELRDPIGDGKDHFMILGTLEGDNVVEVPYTVDAAQEQNLHDFAFVHHVPGGVIDRDTEWPPYIPVGWRRPLERVKDKQHDSAPVPPKKPGDKTPNPTTEEPAKVVELGTMHAEEDEEPKKPEEDKKPEEKIEVAGEKMTAAEYAALKDDLKLINERIQNHKGIITVTESDFKSKLGKKMYNELNHVIEGAGRDGFNSNPESFMKDGVILPEIMQSVLAISKANPGLRTTFNAEELRKMGDAIERALMAAKVEAEEEKAEAEKAPNVISRQENDDYMSDIAFLDGIMKDSPGTRKVQFTREDIKSPKTLALLEEMLKKEYNKDFTAGEKTVFSKSDIRPILGEITDILESSVVDISPKKKKGAEKKDDEPKNPDADVIELGKLAAERVAGEEEKGPEMRKLTSEEHKELEADLEFLNTKEQKSEGIITISLEDLQSPKAIELFLVLRNFLNKEFAEDERMVFNKTEIREMGDALESFRKKGETEVVPAGEEEAAAVELPADASEEDKKKAAQHQKTLNVIARMKNKGRVTLRKDAEKKAAKGEGKKEEPKKEEVKAEEEKKEEPKTEKKAELGEITEEEMETLRTTGHIDYKRLVSIASKFQKGEALTDLEQEMRSFPEVAEKVEALLSENAEMRTNVDKKSYEGGMEFIRSGDAFLKVLLPEAVRKAFAKFDRIKVPVDAFKKLRMKGATVTGDLKLMVKNEAGVFREVTVNGFLIENNNNFLDFGRGYAIEKNSDSAESREQIREALAGIRGAIEKQFQSEGIATRSAELTKEGVLRTTFDRKG